MIIWQILILNLGCIAGTDSFILKLSFGLLKKVDCYEHPSPLNFYKQFEKESNVPVNQNALIVPQVWCLK